jgi:hypothetical protein
MPIGYGASKPENGKENSDGIKVGFGLALKRRY